MILPNMMVIKVDDLQKKSIKDSVVLTIGTFDGVHKGHQFVLQQIQRYKPLTTVLVTFEKHPITIIKQKKNVDLVLTPIQEKIKYIEQSKMVDYLYLLPFNDTIANMDATDFLENYIFQYFSPKIFLLGHDNRFGKDKKGDFNLLRQYTQKYDMKIEILEILSCHNIVYSSTSIRNFLKEGNVEQANQMLGYAYSMEGIVVHGAAMGRKIGFPTANMQLLYLEKLIPKYGVYAVRVRIEGFDELFYGMTNIGKKPTLGNFNLSIETHIFNFEEMIYDRVITIFLHQFIREEKKFTSLDKLKEQLHQDENTVFNFFQL